MNATKIAVSKSDLQAVKKSFDRLATTMQAWARKEEEAYERLKELGGLMANQIEKGPYRNDMDYFRSISSQKDVDLAGLSQAVFYKALKRYRGQDTIEANLPQGQRTEEQINILFREQKRLEGKSFRKPRSDKKSTSRSHKVSADDLNNDMTMAKMFEDGWTGDGGLLTKSNWSILNIGSNHWKILGPDGKQFGPLSQGRGALEMQWQCVERQLATQPRQLTEAASDKPDDKPKDKLKWYEQDNIWTNLAVEGCDEGVYRIEHKELPGWGQGFHLYLGERVLVHSPTLWDAQDGAEHHLNHPWDDKPENRKGMVHAPNPAKPTNEAGNCEWFTPKHLVDAARSVLGGVIELDPATTAKANETVKAKRYYTQEQDGLSQDWSGTTWLNPPYKMMPAFVEKLLDHVAQADIKEAILLCNNATETEWFHKMLQTSDGVCFHFGRIKFVNGTGRDSNSSGSGMQGQVLFYIGPSPERFLVQFKKIGFCIELRTGEVTPQAAPNKKRRKKCK